MSRPPGKDQFAKDVYTAELKEIKRRREAAELPKEWLNVYEKAREAAENSFEGDEKGVIHPDVSHGTVGLALSGGGIRSATFNLGVLQAFAKHGLISYFLVHMNGFAECFKNGRFGSGIKCLNNIII